MKAFETWHGMTVAPPTDPNLLWDTRGRLDHYDVLRRDEIDQTVGLLVTLSDPKQHGLVYAALAPAIERFHELSEEERLEFKDALDKFVRTYSFLSQVVSMTSSKCTSGSSELSSRGETGHCWSGAQCDFDVRSEWDADGA
ncbi:MAG: hypothetical protein M0Z95_05830, partial [Actinomycetota bacterium]|nr:hypothetical protein [Actinomycetota bacterium]